mmetsp:Transcript_104367/g.181360  ORF Transcript_104367/g.181360 Transcript_104367/m.181360 type:complete len:337 (+) Transcript_104367:407-1417(+)
MLRLSEMTVAFATFMKCRIMLKKLSFEIEFVCSSSKNANNLLRSSLEIVASGSSPSFFVTSGFSLSQDLKNFTKSDSLIFPSLSASILAKMSSFFSFLADRCWRNIASAFLQSTSNSAISVLLMSLLYLASADVSQETLELKASSCVVSFCAALVVKFFSSSSASSVSKPFTVCLAPARLSVTVLIIPSVSSAASLISAAFAATAAGLLIWPGKVDRCFSTFPISSCRPFTNSTASAILLSSSTFMLASLFSLANRSSRLMSSMAFSLATPIMTVNLCRSVCFTPLPPSVTRTLNMKSTESLGSTNLYSPRLKAASSLRLSMLSLSVSYFLNTATC